MDHTVAFSDTLVSGGYTGTSDTVLHVTQSHFDRLTSLTVAIFEFWTSGT
jgi:hypothetical protein